MTSSRISVVGAGYVGSVTAACLAEIGHEVTCADINPERIEAIRQGRAPVREPGLPELISAVVSSGRLRATTDVVGAVASSQLTMVAVGTPVAGETMELSALARACEQIGLGLREQTGYHVVAVRSTVVPGTTEGLVRQHTLRASGLGESGVGWCMNPEFLREGSALEDARHPDRIVIGQSDERAGRVLAGVYEPFACPVIRTTLRNAELIKCASNALLATLISFSNELAGLCEALPDTDVEVILRALHLDRRWSPVFEGRRITPEILAYLRSGCGFGGSCLPKDLQALRTYVNQQGLTPHLLDAVLTVNRERPRRIVGLLERVLRPIEGTTVAVFGLAFKPGTDDVRDSPALAVIEELLRAKAAVRAYDPIAVPAARADLQARAQLCDTAEEACTDADAVVIATAWTDFQRLDWTDLTRRMRRAILLDGRHALDAKTLPPGVTYVRIGQAPDVVPQMEAVAG